MPGAAGATEKEQRAPAPERPKWTLSGEHAVRRRQGWACVAVTRYRGKVPGGWYKGAGLHEGGKGAGPQRKDTAVQAGWATTGDHHSPSLAFLVGNQLCPESPPYPTFSHIRPPSTRLHCQQRFSHSENSNGSLWGLCSLVCYKSGFKFYSVFPFYFFGDEYDFIHFFLFIYYFYF